MRAARVQIAWPPHKQVFKQASLILYRQLEAADLLQREGMEIQKLPLRCVLVYLSCRIASGFIILLTTQIKFSPNV